MTRPGALESKKTLHGPFLPTVHESSFEASVLIYRIDLFLSVSAKIPDLSGD
jgi:hypothetical protein